MNMKMHSFTGYEFISGRYLKKRAERRPTKSPKITDSKNKITKLTPISKTYAKLNRDSSLVVP